MTAPWPKGIILKEPRKSTTSAGGRLGEASGWNCGWKRGSVVRGRMLELRANGVSPACQSSSHAKQLALERINNFKGVNVSSHSRRLSACTERSVGTYK